MEETIFDELYFSILDQKGIQPLYTLYPKVERQTKPHVVYGLLDPLEGGYDLNKRTVRYIGYTCDVSRRYWEHLSGALKGGISQKDDWIRFLRLKNLFPDMIIFKEFDNESDARSSESHALNKWVRNLLNSETRRFKAGLKDKFFAFNDLEIVLSTGEVINLKNGIARRDSIKKSETEGVSLY